MDELLQRRYKKVLDILPDVAECTRGKLVLAGGTALALFHLEHRISIDLDFIPLHGKEERAKEALKGCLSRKGYRTTVGAYSNQFVVQFEDTGIKIEIFSPKHKIKGYIEFDVGSSKMLVCSVDEILELKMESYADRKEAKDLFDVIFILKERAQGFGAVEKLLSETGPPVNMDYVRRIALGEEDYQYFVKVVEDASKTGNK